MVAMIDDTSDDLIKFVQVDHGIRHLKFNYSELEANRDFINDPNTAEYEPVEGELILFPSSLLPI